MLESTFTISPFNVEGGVSFILVLNLWYGGMRVVHHDVSVFVIQEVNHITLKQTILGNLKCWHLWSADDKILSILAVVGQNLIFMDQAEGQYIRYYIGVIPDGIGISGEVANFVGVYHSCIKMDT